MLTYINAHGHPSRNIDSCRIGGILHGLRFGEIHRGLLSADQGLSGQVARDLDPDPHGAVGRPYKVIGRFTFQTDRGWNFARKSMIYNAQVHGADTVLLWAANAHREVSVQYAPPKVDWYPAYRHSKHGKVSTRVPYVRPGYP